MMNRKFWKIGLVAALSASLMTVAAPQLKQVLKIFGVGAAVQKFAPQINSAINKLSKTQDTSQYKTKVVPILRVALGRSGAIGAAQVMGPPRQVDKVKAVAQLEAELFGKEIGIRALIPVTSDRNLSNPERVVGVGVSGIVDLKL